MRRDNSLSRFRRVFVSIKPRSSRRAAWLFCNYIRPWRRRRLLRDSYAGAFHFTFPGARALSGWRGADHERARRGRFSRCTASCAAGIFPNARTFRAPFPSCVSRATNLRDGSLFGSEPPSVAQHCWRCTSFSVALRRASPLHFRVRFQLVLGGINANQHWLTRKCLQRFTK